MKTKKTAQKKPPLSAAVKAPIGPDGEYVKILEYRDGEVTYFVPDELRIDFINRLLEKAAETLSKM